MHYDMFGRVVEAQALKWAVELASQGWMNVMVEEDAALIVNTLATPRNMEIQDVHIIYCGEIYKFQSLFSSSTFHSVRRCAIEVLCLTWHYVALQIKEVIPNSSNGNVHY